MKYSYKNIHIIKELLEKETFISKCRRKETNYIRKRKLKAMLSKIPYYIFGMLPIKKNKIVCKCSKIQF